MWFEIWLDDSRSHFNHGIIHHEDGHIEELRGRWHVGMFEDSYLLFDERNPIGWLSWFPTFLKIEIYHWQRGLDRVVFHDVGELMIQTRASELSRNNGSVEYKRPPSRDFYGNER